jgi:methionine--tRNA ligase beta chain
MSIAMKDFERLDIRVGRIVAAENIAGMKKIMKAAVDLGDRRVNAIIGGAEYHKPEDLQGRLVAVIANMEARTVAGVRSECMLLAADDHGKPIWLTVPEGVAPGTKIR